MRPILGYVNSEIGREVQQSNARLTFAHIERGHLTRIRLRGKAAWRGLYSAFLQYNQDTPRAENLCN